MKNFLTIVIICVFGITSCTNPNQKEIAEVDALFEIINDAEKSLLSIDTALVFGAKRQMDMDIAEVSEINDTITREEAFRLDDIFRSKKGFKRITSNYPGFLHEIEFTKNQLNNLKQDLENGLIKKEDYKTHFSNEEEYILMLTGKISKTINGLDIALEKQKSDRPELLEIIKNKKMKAAINE
jgi:hypothetical protein